MDNYKRTCFEVVQIAEKELNFDVLELKTAIEEVVSVNSQKSFFSLPLSPEFLCKERYLATKHNLNVSGARHLKSQGQIIIDQLENALVFNVTSPNFPLVLHQFFLDQVQSLVHCYHSYLLRWKRLSEHTDTLVLAYNKYKSSLSLIRSLHKDYTERAQRLAAFNHSHLVKDISTNDCLEPDDVAIFLRWLVVHLHSIKKVFCFIKKLRWLSVSYRQNISTKAGNILDSHEVNQGKNDSTAMWKNVAAEFDFTYLSPTTSTQKVSAHSSSSSVPIYVATFFGNISNEITNGIPCHKIELDHLRNHLESLVLEYGIVVRSEIISSSDEMELFGAVNRQFKTLFNRQLECTTFFQYDNAPEGYSYWGIDSSSHCLKKPTNWLDFVHLKPRYKVDQLQQTVWLKELKYKDALLSSHNQFLDVSDFALVTEALKEHAVAVRRPPSIQALNVTSNPIGELKTKSVWNNVYNIQESNNKNKNLFNHFQNLGAGDTWSKQLQRKESYNYLNTLQMLGLEDGEDSIQQNFSIIQGSYLSFLHLRHLKIKDLKRQCLACLNYFRSIERMITIYDGGLSKEGKDVLSKESSVDFFCLDQKKKKNFAHRNSSLSKSNHLNQSRLLSNGLDSQQNNQDSPDQFKVNYDDFMEFASVENHDDFYTLDCSIDKSGVRGTGITALWKSAITAASITSPHPDLNIPHVQDFRGFYIVYDAALNDLEKLDDELILMGSYYIEKDVANCNCQKSNLEKVQTKSNNNGIDIASFAHQDIDRFAVLLDLWTCELNFLIHKKKLMECFIESFHLIFDPNEKRNISQVLSWHMDKYKSYLNRVSGIPHVAGMPLHCTARQEVSVNSPEPALRHVSLLEFHPHLGIVAVRLYDALEVAISKSTQMKSPSRISDVILIERQVLERASQDWENMPVVGSSFSETVQKDLFADDFIEDVYLVDHAIKSICGDDASDNENKLDSKSSTAVWLSAVEALLLRHRFIEAAWETEVVSKLYKRAASRMGFDHSHLYLPPVQLEQCKKIERPDPAPSRLSNFVAVDVLAKRYSPLVLDLAVRELDSIHLGEFSFQTPDCFKQIITSKEEIKNIQIALGCQITHKNSAVVAMTQFENCAMWKDVKQFKVADLRRTLTKCNSNVQGQCSDDILPIRKSLGSSTVIKKSLDIFSSIGRLDEKLKRSPESFISIQLEKTGPRDVMINAFLHATETKSTLMKNSEVVRLKQGLVSDYCREVSFRMSLHAMRSQIIMYYSGILTALASYPMMRQRFFMLGSAFEEKGEQDSALGMVPDPKVFRKRPRRVFSVDGKSFLNLWFIPHFTEVLMAFRSFDYKVQDHVLSLWLGVVSSLHDIVLHLCARYRLSRSCALQCRPHVFCPAPVHWEEAQEIGLQLNEIQVQIDALDSGPLPFTKDPKKVAEFLEMKKEILYAEFDVAVRFLIREKFLSLGNHEAFQLITDVMTVALAPLTNATQASLTAINMPLPHILSYDIKEARNLTPWLSFELSNGYYPDDYSEYGQNPGTCMLLCLAGLLGGERGVAGEQLQAISGLLDRVLLDGTATYEALEIQPDLSPRGFMTSITIGREQQYQLKERKKLAERKLSGPDVPGAARRVLEQTFAPRFDPNSPLNKLQFPIDACRLMKIFLRLWKQLETFKSKLARARLGCDSINTPILYQAMEQIINSDIALPVYIDIASRMGRPDLYYEIEPADGTLLPPPGVPIVAVKAELLKKLLEVWELRAIADARDSIRRRYRSLLLAEHETCGSKPSSHSSVPETFDLVQYSDHPAIVRDFVHRLIGRASVVGDQVAFKKEHVNECLLELGRIVIQRERDDFLSFTSRFKNLLRHYETVLERNELQTSAFHAERQTQMRKNVGLATHFKLADRSPELIMELTALRTKVADMTDNQTNMEIAVRNDALFDCEELVRGLFDACLDLKARMAMHYNSIVDDVLEVIASTRQETLKKMSRVKEIDLSSTENERLLIERHKEAQVYKLINKNHQIDQHLDTIRTFRCWQDFTASRRLETKVSHLDADYTRIRRMSICRCLTLKEIAEKDFDKLMEVRRSLRLNADKVIRSLEEIEQRRKWKKEKEFKEMMKTTSRRILGQAKDQRYLELNEFVKERKQRLGVLEDEVKRSLIFNKRSQRKLKEALKESSHQVEVERLLREGATELAEQLRSRLLLADDPNTIPQLPPHPVIDLGKVTEFKLRTRRGFKSSQMPKRSASCLPPASLRSSLPKKRSDLDNHQSKKRLAAAILGRNWKEYDQPTTHQ